MTPLPFKKFIKIHNKSVKSLFPDKPEKPDYFKLANDVKQNPQKKTTE
jgi:hypothetical protein